MDVVINGKHINKKFISAIKRRRKKLFEDALPFIETSNAEDVVEKIDDDNFIMKEDKEEYDILMTLLSYVDFSKEPSNNTYEFKGLEYKSGSRTNRTSIFVSKENALKISKLANDYEDKLRRSNTNANDKKMSIKFPVELLMLKYKGENMPGLDYEAPEPKTANKTRQEYEDGLETYYNSHGVDKELDSITDFRKAYPHEKINYRIDPPEMTDVIQTGYYDDIVRELATQGLGADHGVSGLEPGEGQIVTATDLPLGRRIGQRILELQTLFKSPGFKKTIAKGLLVSGIGIAAISCLSANPIFTISVAVGGGVSYLGGKYIIPKANRAFKAIKSKVKDWLFGPVLTENPNPPVEETPSEEEELSVEELTNRISNVQNQISIIDRQISALETEIESLAKGSPERIDKEKELTAKLTEKRAKLNEVSALLYQHDLIRAKGGRRK